MPIIRVSKRDLELLLGVTLDIDTIYRGLARLKCEIEAIWDDTIEYEANSDRPDLFSVEGLSRALRPWLGLEWREYVIGESHMTGYAKDIPQRPYVALAVVRDLALSDEAVSQIMQLQEKITQTYGRARKKLSIGVYDLDRIKPPVYYELVEPDVFSFRPLGESKEMTLKQVLENTEKGVMYGHIIRHMEKYPVLRDSEGNVLSLVPIINSEECKVETSTRNILVDATGVSIEDVVNAVTIMVTSIAERSRSGSIETVKVYYENGALVEAPRKAMEPLNVSVDEVNGLLGTKLESRDVAELLGMFYYRIIKALDRLLIVQPPVYRVDVNSWVDVAEDVAIAYGYERLGREAHTMPPAISPGRTHTIEYLSKRLRDILLGLGFQEIANYMMSSRLIQLDLLGVEREMIVVSNPRSERFEGLRIWLAPQLLEVIKDNSEKRSRLFIFEIGDVILPNESSETRVRVERRLGLAITHEKATLTDGMAYVKSTLRELGISPMFMKGAERGFLPERTAVVIACGGEVGFVGEVDPRILYKLQLKNPVVVAELHLNKIISLCT